MRDARPLVRLLADPSAAAAVTDWTGLIALARAESLIGALAWRLDGAALPERVEALLAAARRDGESARAQALWEAEMARRALAPLGVPVILLKGTAYAAAGLDAGRGRSIGDLDILVPRDALADVERALLAAGWEWVKEDAYDDLYYRRWMHELPPLIHRERDRMIDVHHAILPLTARPKPDMAAMIEARVAARRRPLHPVAARHDRPRRRPPVRRRRPRRGLAEFVGHRPAAARVRRAGPRLRVEPAAQGRAAWPACFGRPGAPPRPPYLQNSTSVPGTEV